MKKLLLKSIFITSASSLFAQLPVSQTPSNKKALIEEFTGIHCTYCPDGHKIAGQILAANPGTAFAVNIHTGGYATPSGSELDFRTADGDAIAAIPQMGITGYPTGAVNRHLFSGSALAMSRSAWSSSVSTIQGASAYVNVAGAATIDVATNQLTLNLEAYYTANSPASTNKITVMLLQNNIIGTQTGSSLNPGAVNPDGTYTHQHALRDILTATLGDVISTTTMGTTYTNTINYTIPATIKNIPVDLSNLEIIVFVTENTNEIINVAEAPITYTGFTTALNASAASLVTEAQVCVTSTSPKFTMKNLGSTTLTSANISYSVNGGTPSVQPWTGSLAPLASIVVTLPSISYTLGASNNIAVNITNVNGSADEDMANNTVTSTFAQTTAAAGTLNLKLDLTQDQYGSEITWKFKDAAGTVVASGGPYADLAASGILLNTHNVVLPAGGCYRFEVADSYGDGINAGTGAGSITIKDGTSATVYSSNGVYGSLAYRNFNATGLNTTGLNEFENKLNMSLFPNPADDKLNVTFTAEYGNYDISMVDVAGRNVYTSNYENLSGTQTIALPIADINAGTYFVKISSNGASFTQQVVIK